MLTDYPEGVTTALVLVFPKTLRAASGSAGALRGRAAGKGISQRRTGRERLPQPPRRLRTPGAAPGRTRWRAGQEVPSGRCRQRPRGIPGCGVSGTRGLRAPAGTGTALSPGADTTANKTPRARSAAAASSTGRHRRSLRARRGFRCGQPRHGRPGHLPAPPRSPARAGMAGATPASSAAAAPAGPAAGPPPGSPSRLPARPQRAALTCGGWGRAAPAALRSAPAPLSCAAASLRGHLRAGAAGRGLRWDRPGGGTVPSKPHGWAGHRMQIRQSRGSASL